MSREGRRALRDCGLRRECLPRRLAPGDHLLLLALDLPQQAVGGMVEERIHGGQVRLDRVEERGAHDGVDARHELGRALGAQELLERRLQPLVGRRVELQRRLAHLGDACAQRGTVFAVEPEVQAERALDLPLRRRREMRGGRLVEPARDVVVVLEPLDRRLDTQPGLRRALVGADAGERRDAEVVDADACAHWRPLSGVDLEIGPLTAETCGAAHTFHRAASSMVRVGGGRDGFFAE